MAPGFNRPWPGRWDRFSPSSHHLAHGLLMPGPFLAHGFSPRGTIRPTGKVTSEGAQGAPGKEEDMGYEKQLRVKVDPESYDRYADYAEERFGGNISEALRQLLEQGYRQVSTSEMLDRYFEEHFDPRCDELEERLAKVTSKGTKASLGNLTLMSEIVMAVCMILRSIDRDNHTIMRAMHLKVDEDSEGARDRIYDMMTRHPSQIFCWAWDAGGRMQAQPGSPNFVKATRNLAFRYPEMDDE